MTNNSMDTAVHKKKHAFECRAQTKKALYINQ